MFLINKQYVAISPYNKEHYFIAFKDRSIKYNFKGAPKEWMVLMTEVFKSWSTEPMPSQPPPLTQPNYQAPPRYYPEQQYPQGQAWQQPQPYHQQVQAAYNHNSPAQYSAHLAGYHNGSGMPSPAPSYHSPVAQHAMPSPAPSYHSPVPQHMMPNLPQWSAPPQPPPVELPASLPAELPVELPGDFSQAGPSSMPPQKTTTEVSRSSMALLARDLWGADDKLEKEEVAV